jgi:hypothetical protein
LSISEDQDNAAPGDPEVAGSPETAHEGDPDDTPLHEPPGGDLDELDDLDGKPDASAATKWGVAGLLLVYAGLGSYCVATILGNMAGKAVGAPAEGVTRSVAAALNRPTGSSGTVAAGADSSSWAVAKSHAVRAARRAQAAGPAGSADSRVRAPAPVVVLAAVSAVAVGPDGTTGGDHPQLAPYVIDPHSATAWITHWYASAHFGNLKDGTGLLLDMGKLVTIRQVELALGGSPGFWGADLQIRVGDTPNLSGATPVAMASGVGGWVSAQLPHAVTGRYIQIWFTKLPLDSWGTYQEHVYGVTVRGSNPMPHSAGSGSSHSPRGATITRDGRAGSSHDHGHGGSGYGGYGGYGGGHGDGWGGDGWGGDGADVHGFSGGHDVGSGGHDGGGGFGGGGFGGSHASW